MPKTLHTLLFDVDRQSCTHSSSGYTLSTYINLRHNGFWSKSFLQAECHSCHPINSINVE